MRRISILGATGSIGRNTVELVQHLGGFETVAVTGRSNVEALARIARTLGAEIAVTSDPERLGDLREHLAGSGIEAAAGPGALVEAASRPVDILMSAIVGAAGLPPTLAAVRQGAAIALANKECLVAAGALFLDEVRRHGATLLPVDSEHNAIFQCRAADREAGIERLLLTASGGPFRTWSRERMAAATPEEAAAHPNWSMGLRISIDSASMFNKALEMIEAHHLFGVPSDTIEVVVHPQSIVHSMVGFADGTILAHLGPADMRVAIGHALAWPTRAALPVERVDFAKLARLDFEAPDPARFPALDLARRAMDRGAAAGCVLNAAHEVAIDAFCDRRIGFLEMADVVARTMDRLDGLPAAASVDDVDAADSEARHVARELVPEAVA